MYCKSLWIKASAKYINVNVNSKGDSDREHHPDPSGLEFAVPVGPQGILTNLTESNASLLKSMNKDYQKRVKKNRDYIKTVADVLLLTATQNIPQRGHRESENKGNFLAILEQMAKHDPIVNKKLSSGNAEYTSNNTQK